MQCDGYMVLTERNTLNTLNEIWTGCSGVLVLSNFFLNLCLSFAIISVLHCSYSHIFYHLTYSYLILWRSSLLKWVLSLQVIGCVLWRLFLIQWAKRRGESNLEAEPCWGWKRESLPKRSLFEENICSQKKKGDRVEDEPVLYYSSWFSEGILTACFVGWIPFLIQVQRISPNAGQSASCMETEDANTSFWLWTCRNAELLCVIFLQWSKAVIWKTIDLIVLVRKMVKITDFNEFSQERLKAWILVFIHMFYLENRGKLGKRPCFAATVKCSRLVRNTSFPWIFLQGTFWGSCPPGLWGPLVC